MNNKAKRYHSEIYDLEKEIDGIKDFISALEYEMTSHGVCRTFLKVEIKKTFLSVFTNRVEKTVPIPDKLNCEIHVRCISWIEELERRILKNTKLLQEELEKSSITKN
jgi:hypothetical protein